MKGVVNLAKTKKTKKTKKAEEIDLDSLRKTFETRTDDKSKLALDLLKRAEFMRTTLIALEDKVNSEGVVTEMSQGSYSIDRENPALRSYNTTIKNYTSVIKQIVDLLPAQENQSKAGNALAAFVAS